MNAINKLKLLKNKIEKIQKLNEDLMDTHLAKNNKIDSLENKIKILKKGIKETADEIEKLTRDIDANI
tara:strand:+ start:1123 stop:1326 length:204 start_codon:yes stop_codon:yes gene_type:complete